MHKVIDLLKLILHLVPSEAKKDLIDAILDEIEKRNNGDHVIMTLCSIARSILGVPDDDVDQENPI